MIRERDGGERDEHREMMARLLQRDGAGPTVGKDMEMAEKGSGKKPRDGGKRLQ